jgi:predicted nucleic acid-binding protein
VNRYLVDTNVFVYARGGDHRYRDPCRAILRAAGDGRLTLEASVELVQEFAHLLLRRGFRPAAVLDEVEEVRSQCRLHAFDIEVLGHATTLLRRHPSLGVRDAVHAATAIRAGLASILSADRIFDSIDGVTRIDPATSDGPWRDTP